MKSFKNLSSQEMIDIQGGDWWDDVVDFIEAVLDDVITSFEEGVDRTIERQP